MFMQGAGVCGHAPDENENVCWLVNEEPSCERPLYRSIFATKVRCDTWARKEGCCKTIGPPPKICINCPTHFLRKHSRVAPVYFSPDELKLSKEDKEKLGKSASESQIRGKRFPRVRGSSLPKFQKGKRSNNNNNECPYPKPPSRMGLFRSPQEPAYEVRYRQAAQMDCDCDMWEHLMLEQMRRNCGGRRQGTAGNVGGGGGDMGSGGQFGAYFANMNSGGGAGTADADADRGPTKDYIRANALNVIRMPARRLRRCYVGPNGIHLIDMSDSPYVLRPGFGKVPSYIYRRKCELLEEDMRARQMAQEQAMDDCCMQQVEDMERQMVIMGLKDYWGRLLQEYNSIPLTGEGSERNRELKQNLEARLKEVENDLRLLTSTNMLYVGDVDVSQYL